MSKSIRITNASGRDGSAQVISPKRETAPTLGIPGHSILFQRYLSTTESGRGEALAESLGDDYAQALIDGNPEIDIEHVGRTITETNVVFLSSKGEFLHCPPNFIEVITTPDGKEKERRVPVDIESNVDDERPVRWTGKKIPIADAVRRFMFRRSLQVSHVDGVTYDFLHAMAKELAAERSLMLVGAGAKGADPLVFQANGRPCRGFLEGRVDGEKYQIMLHLSDMELKRPVSTKED
jgi:hypothetical protein